MKEPDGMVERLRIGQPTLLDLEFVDHRLSVAVDRTELKLLRNLRARIVASTSGAGNASGKR